MRWEKGRPQVVGGALQVTLQSLGFISEPREALEGGKNFFPLLYKSKLL